MYMQAFADLESYREVARAYVPKAGCVVQAIQRSNPTSRIRAFENCNVLEIKAGISKVCTTPAQLPRSCLAVILGGGCSGNFNFNFSSNSRWSGSGCV